ncbi:MAG: protein-L-isoaspartate O-methyltransferase [Hyphomicrobiales bacterium]|nr:protein-L-isoaspartate O-methyltransferase [Hyphomicrobiales bacterium]
MTDYAVARANMVESQIRPNQVTDRRILQIMLEIPREIFVPPAMRSLAYMDEEFTFEASGGSAEASSGSAADRSMLAPMPLARLIQLAAIGAEDVVLDIGCATGYSSAVLARLAEAVVGLECDGPLAEAAGRNMIELETDNAAIVTGDLASGYPDESPYDAILLQGSVSDVPDALLAQLKNGGRLVTVVGDRSMGQACLFRNFDGKFSRVAAFDAGAPALPGFERVQEFVF